MKEKFQHCLVSHVAEMHNKDDNNNVKDKDGENRPIYCKVLYFIF